MRRTDWPLKRLIAEKPFVEFLGYVELGVPVDNACWLVGIVSSTMKAWMRKGEEGLFPYDVLYDEVKKAESMAVANMVGSIAQAARDPKGWRAAAWMLERLRPDVFSSSRETEYEETDYEIVIGGEGELELTDDED